MQNPIRELREKSGFTQQRLAELAGTSQPAIAAYEAGRKSPNLRTLERLARAAGLEANVEFLPPMTREDRRSRHLHRAIAKRLVREPAFVLGKARHNLKKMLENSPGLLPLVEEWERVLELTPREVADVLLDPRPRARELRHTTPFAGVLSASERAKVYRRFAASQRAS